MRYINDIAHLRCSGGRGRSPSISNVFYQVGRRNIWSPLCLHDKSSVSVKIQRSGVVPEARRTRRTSAPPPSPRSRHSRRSGYRGRVRGCALPDAIAALRHSRLPARGEQVRRPTRQTRRRNGGLAPFPSERARDRSLAVGPASSACQGRGGRTSTTATSTSGNRSIVTVSPRP